MLYTMCKMFSESHAPGIQIPINENVQFKYLTVGLASNAVNKSTILSENTNRT